MSPTLSRSIKSKKTTTTKSTFSIGKLLPSLGRAIVFGEALIRHVARCAPRADEDLALLRLKRDVLHVGLEPAVGLSVHRLGPQRRGHQVDALRRERTASKQVVNRF